MDRFTEIEVTFSQYVDPDGNGEECVGRESLSYAPIVCADTFIAFMNRVCEAAGFHYLEVVRKEKEE